MARATRATKALEAANIAFAVHSYDYDPSADSIGLQAAQALGEAPERVLKTLMTLVDGKPVCVILPSNHQLSMKKLAAALSGKVAQMMPPNEAERLTAYKVGGISPFGQMRKVPVVIEESAMTEALVYINAGQRGLQVQLNPRDAAAMLSAIVAPVTASQTPS